VRREDMTVKGKRGKDRKKVKGVSMMRVFDSIGRSEEDRCGTQHISDDTLLEKVA
jgi:hypothetical protein